MARDAGAHDVILYSEEDFAAAVNHMTKNVGADVVFDGVGRTTWEGNLRCVRPRGHVVLYGASSGSVPLIDPLALMPRSLYLTRPTLWAYLADEREFAWRAADVLHWLASGDVRIDIGAAFPLKDAVAAHRALQGRSTTGKVILTLT